ncbi:DegV family protein [Olsenella urininfantis]|uniref:DegV family protein n=1 Tax=Olsenella urininfantis TaxID=1871033 RepID=UPI000985E236|nr:DegV family protein [Olsenella urininfantis]
MPAKFFLMTDSPCDFTQQMVEEAQIGCLHFSYTEANDPNGLSGEDDLFQQRDPHEFYEAIRKGACPMTSQPSQLEFERAFRAAAERDTPTVYLCFSSGISGCYEGARTALARLEEEAGGKLPISIVDLKLGSTAQYLFMVEAIRQRDKGLTAEEMVLWAKEARYFVQTIFMVDDLAALHRGGRVPKSVAVIGGALDVKPLLTFDLDGALSVVGISRGRKKGLKKLASFYEKNRNMDLFSNVVAIGNADCERDAERLSDIIHKSEDSAVTMVSTIGPTIGCHVGPGMVSCCFWGADRRKSASVSDQISQNVRGN